MNTNSTIRRNAGLLLLSLLSGACQMNGTTMASDNTKEQDMIKTLSWVTSANPAEDAELAIQNGITELLGLAARGAPIPGVPEGESADYQSQCGVRLLEGTGDAVYGETHLQLLQQIREYAANYNRVMMKHCR